MKHKLLGSLGTFLLVAVLSGCESDIDGWEIYRAVKLCEKHDGVDKLGTIIGGLQCRDGTWINRDGKKYPREAQ